MPGSVEEEVSRIRNLSFVMIVLLPLPLPPGGVINHHRVERREASLLDSFGKGSVLRTTTGHNYRGQRERQGPQALHLPLVVGIVVGVVVSGATATSHHDGRRNGDRGRIMPHICLYLLVQLVVYLLRKNIDHHMSRAPWLL